LDKVYVLDSFALIAHFEGEARGERVHERAQLMRVMVPSLVSVTVVPISLILIV